MKENTAQIKKCYLNQKKKRTLKQKLENQAKIHRKNETDKTKIFVCEGFEGFEGSEGSEGSGGSEGYLLLALAALAA